MNRSARKTDRRPGNGHPSRGQRHRQRAGQPPPPVIEPGAIVTELCQGPRTIWELAAALHCRPTCLHAALGILMRHRVVARERHGVAAQPPALWRKFYLALDPAAGFVLKTALWKGPKKSSKNLLRGSPEYLYREAVRHGEQSPHSSSSSLGVPVEGPPTSGHML